MDGELDQLKLQNQEMFKELLRLREGPDQTDRMITYDTVKQGNTYQTEMTNNLGIHKGVIQEERASSDDDEMADESELNENDLTGPAGMGINKSVILSFA